MSSSKAPAGLLVSSLTLSCHVYRRLVSECGGGTVVGGTGEVVVVVVDGVGGVLVGGAGGGAVSGASGEAVVGAWRDLDWSMSFIT